MHLQREFFWRSLLMSTFSDNLARANERLGIHQAGANELVPIGFRVGDHENEPGKNLGSLTILWDASERFMTVAQVLPEFGEHFAAVTENPGGTDHANIRALMRIDRAAYVGSVVSFHGVPITPKVVQAA